MTKEKILKWLSIAFLCFAIYAFTCRNEFAYIVAMFSGIAGLISCYKWQRTKQKENWDDPQWDCTDAAHPAWWRGEKWSAFKAAELIAKILSGEDTGKGIMNEPLETMRRSVQGLKKDHDADKQNLTFLITEGIELEKTYEKYRAISQEQQKNAAETLRELRIERDNALEQRTADWDRVRSLEREVDNLKGEILTLKDTIQKGCY